MRVLLVACLLASCGTPEPECVSTVDCGGGMRACLDGTCREVDCLAGADCPLEQTCDPVGYTCVPGCSTSDDCRAGDRCDVTTGACVARSCTDTQTDCRLGERCVPETGRCETDPEPHCEICRRDEDCGPTGMCALLERGQPPYCLLSCSPEAFDACPAGLQCTDVAGEGDEPEYRCVGLCGEK